MTLNGKLDLFLHALTTRTEQNAWVWTVSARDPLVPPASIYPWRYTIEQGHYRMIVDAGDPEYPRLNRLHVERTGGVSGWALRDVLRNSEALIPLVNALHGQRDPALQPPSFEHLLDSIVADLDRLSERSSA